MCLRLRRCFTLLNMNYPVIFFGWNSGRRGPSCRLFFDVLIVGCTLKIVVVAFFQCAPICIHIQRATNIVRLFLNFHTVLLKTFFFFLLTLLFTGVRTLINTFFFKRPFSLHVRQFAARYSKDITVIYSRWCRRRIRVCKFISVVGIAIDSFNGFFLNVRCVCLVA